MRVVDGVGHVKGQIGKELCVLDGSPIERYLHIKAGCRPELGIDRDGCFAGSVDGAAVNVG